MTVSCHQPNFFPRLSFFNKMRQSDAMVMLNHSQFQKGKYNNRFMMDDKWYTMPVESGLTPLTTKLYINPDESWAKIKSSLPDYEVLRLFDDCFSPWLCTFNREIIKKSAYFMGIKTEILEDWPTSLTASERLADICHFLGADTYLSGPSGRKYLDESEFEKRGIKVIYQRPLPNDDKPLLKHLQCL